MTVRGAGRGGATGESQAPAAAVPAGSLRACATGPAAGRGLQGARDAAGCAGCVRGSGRRRGRASLASARSRAARPGPAGAGAGGGGAGGAGGEGRARAGPALSASAATRRAEQGGGAGLGRLQRGRAAHPGALR